MAWMMASFECQSCGSKIGENRVVLDGAQPVDVLGGKCALIVDAQTRKAVSAPDQVASGKILRLEDGSGVTCHGDLVCFQLDPA